MAVGITPQDDVVLLTVRVDFRCFISSVEYHPQVPLTNAVGRDVPPHRQYRLVLHVGLRLQRRPPWVSLINLGP